MKKYFFLKAKNALEFTVRYKVSVGLSRINDIFFLLMLIKWLYLLVLLWT